MELAQDDVALFYGIFFKLIDYTNDRYQVEPGLKKVSGAEDVDPNAIMPVRDKLWESDVINRIIADNPLGFAGRELSLVASWSRRVVDMIIKQQSGEEVDQGAIMRAVLSNPQIAAPFISAMAKSGNLPPLSFTTNRQARRKESRSNK